MTVNISYGNENYVVVLADAQISFHGAINRQSNSATKLKVFETDDYHGSVCGTGVASFLNRINKEIDKAHSPNPDIFSGKLHKLLESYIDSYKSQLLNSGRKEIEKEVKVLYFPKESNIIQNVHDLIGSDLEKRIFKESGVDLEKASFKTRIELEGKQDKIFTYLINQKMELELSRYKSILESKIREFEVESKNQMKNFQTELLVDVYDKNEKIFKRYGITSTGSFRLNSTFEANGSGLDGANAYLSEALQGVDSEKMLLEEIILHVGNAYAASTINSGVGGTPMIAIINDTEARKLPKDQCAAITNVCGAQRAKIITDKQAYTHLTSILNIKDQKTEEVYSEIAKSLDMSKKCLTKTALKFSEWKEIASK